MVKVNSSFLTKLNLAVEKNVRSGFVDLATKRACWGIKDEGNLALIMGVLNFGDPDHRVWNNSKGVLAPIPPRPWLSNSTEGMYRYLLRRYVNENLPRILPSISKRGVYKGKSLSSQRALGIDDFVKGLAEIGADNARDNWDSGKFQPNSPMTLARKSDPRPLHDTGRMNASAIKAWSE